MRAIRRKAPPAVPLATTTIARAIYERRSTLKLTLREVAEAAGLSVATVYRLETNPARPDIKSLLRVAKWLGVEPGDLL